MPMNIVTVPIAETWIMAASTCFGATAEKLNAGLFVHPWDMLGKEPGCRSTGCHGSSECRRSHRSPICSMIFGGVFERFPRLRVAFAHGGGSFPFTIGRIERAFHVRPDLTAVDNKRNPREYLASKSGPARFYVDSLVHDPDALQMLLKIFGAERVALGSDYPFPLGEEIRGGSLSHRVSALSPKRQGAVLAGTAREFLA